MDKCPIISLNTSIAHPIQYIGFDRALRYQSSVQFSRRKNFSVIPEVDLEFVNWEYFSRNISRYWNPRFMQSEVNVSLRDNGATVLLIDILIL